MKNTLTWLLTLTTITLVAVGITQWRKLTEQKAQLLSLSRELEQKSLQLADLQTRQKRAEAQRHELSRQINDLSAQAQVAASQTSTLASTNAPVDSGKPDSDTAGFGKFLSKMMADPEAKAFLREQQRMMMSQLYGPLVKKLGLTSEEAEKFKELLLNNQMKGAEKAGSLFGGASATNRAEAITAMAAEQKHFDEQLKEFLGDDRYAQYKDYQQTLGERAQLNQFRQQTGDGEGALNDQQAEQLLAIMGEEKKRVADAMGVPLPGSGQSEADLQAMLDGDRLEKLLQAQETANQRVYERARGILSRAQLNSFGQFQTNQMQTMRLGMSMARKLFAPDNTAGGKSPPNQ